MFHPLEDVVAQTHVDREVGRHLPVILDEEAIVLLPHEGRRTRPNIPPSNGGQPQQIRRYRVAGSGGVLRVFGRNLVKGHVSGEKPVVQVAVVLELEADLDTVVALNLGVGA